jgi:hypothetical protein
MRLIKTQKKKNDHPDLIPPNQAWSSGESAHTARQAGPGGKAQMAMLHAKQTPITKQITSSI